ncbi:SKI/DACH domain-containing protein 1-like [Fagus crenata]
MAKDLQQLQESEVVFPDHHDHHRHRHHRHHDINNNKNDTCLDYQEMDHQMSRVLRNSDSKDCNFNKRISNSLPVNIPDSIFHHGDNDDLEDEQDDGEMEPPHVIIGRRLAGKMAFSVSTGNGRTLKGRDLSQVRNSILRMTGFLET